VVPDRAISWCTAASASGLLGQHQHGAVAPFQHPDLVAGDHRRTGMAGGHDSGLAAGQFQRHAVGAQDHELAVEHPLVDVGRVDGDGDAGLVEQLLAVHRARGQDERGQVGAHGGRVWHRYAPPMATIDPVGTAGTAVVTMELERGVVGDLATLDALADAASERGTLVACGRLVAAARSAGVPVVHAVAQWRADRRGTALNTPLTASLSRLPGQILAGTDAVAPVPELGDTSGDLTSVRHHGLTPFTGTDLDPLLRSLGVSTVVACGVSLNVGVLGLCLGAADLGYRVVVPTDAVVGVPAAYGDEVLRNSIAMVATLRTVDDLVAAWT
jgi:nicotinamidase-related amidase